MVNMKIIIKALFITLFVAFCLPVAVTYAIASINGPNPSDPWYVVLNQNNYLYYLHNDTPWYPLWRVRNTCANGNLLGIVEVFGFPGWQYFDSYPLHSGQYYAETINVPRIGWVTNCVMMAQTNGLFIPGKVLLFPTYNMNFLPVIFYDGSDPIE